MRLIDTRASCVRCSRLLCAFVVHTPDVLTHFVCLVRSRTLCAVVVQTHTCVLDARVNLVDLMYTRTLCAFDMRSRSS